MLNSTHTLVSPTPTTLEGYLLEFESSMSVSFVSEYSRKPQTANLYKSIYFTIFMPSELLLYKGEDLRHDHVLITVNTSVSKENNLRPDKKISYISGLTRPISMP